jgi:hypothetical protein
MIQIVYASAAAQPFSLDALNELLTKARLRNSVYSVSGMLLYHSGSFLQVLEGPETGVDRIYASILRDARHRDPKILNRATIARREFKDWSMGFIDTSAWPVGTAGFIDYHRMPLVDEPTAARRYINLFHEGFCRQAVRSD